MAIELQACTRCISDSRIKGIRFDAAGVCNYCRMHDTLEVEYPQGAAAQEKLQKLLETIKLAGRGRNYDCVVGTSGGRDSTYTLYMAVKLGLRPLAVHFDNGWNSDIAVANIRNSVRKLGVDLYTHVADWEEFKSLQLSFLRASVPDAEVPTDVAIFGVLHKAAAEENVRYILNGHSFRTEGLVPLSWTYMDGQYVNSVHRAFDGLPLETVPNFTLWDFIYFTFVKRIKVIPFLNYLDYQHKKVDELLKSELGWEYYGGHHHESYYTKFFQSYYLPQKFKIDKRILEFSALVRSGQLSREEALEKFNSTPYEFDEELIDYTLRKLGITEEEFGEIMKAPLKSFKDYKSYYPVISRLKLPLKFAADMKLIPPLLYQKYFA
ncbi:MAG: N-acetyl sugar amidotransferase [Anaerolineales bacterium]|nr:N-acetyl sugar amidotransferase [Anaerolineales bacterium]